MRTSDLNDRRAFWNNANLLMYPDRMLGAPSTLKVEPFGDRRIATGLPAVVGTPNTFRAEDFDVLYDSPFLVGNFRVLSFEVNGVPHRVVVDGEGNYDPERLRCDTQRIVEAQAEMMGGLPYRDYPVLLMLAAARGGGLEHFNSTALILPRFAFATEADWRSYGTLISHEVFHVWNVKRIRPDALGPFDYTRLLWVVEGVVRSAGLLDDRVPDMRPGEQLTLTVFRNDELRTFPFKLGSRAVVTDRIIPVANANEQQRRNYQAWLGAPFPK